MHPPIAPIDFQGSAYRNAIPSHKDLALLAHGMIELNRFDEALPYLYRMLAAKQIQENPLIVEAYVMLGTIALRRHQYAEACAWFRRSRKPNYAVAGLPRGQEEENVPIYQANEAMFRYLLGVIRKPRMLNAPSYVFEKEANFRTCAVETLNAWAIGQFMGMPALTDIAGVEKLRTSVEKHFSPPTGKYLLFPNSEFQEREPEYVSPSQIPTILSGARGHPMTAPVTRCIYNDDVLERAMGNERGWPEGRLFKIYEAVAYMQSDVAIRPLGLSPNLRAEAMLHLEEGVWGPVLVQMCWLLKHPQTPKSPVVIRMPVDEAFLAGPKWRQMRMEYRAARGRALPTWASGRSRLFR
ncbi:hypothetical protein AURDEDRAFT_122716 [Auricularia subglabra TFB-10046 SS5]|nr:hypothetical protein AURDEDRAFT_122716 [Auricularia subglabra TFB-10046 SS5]